ncbi:MAG: CRISPR-associated endoribonuclease Cas6 [Bacteroidales bacterium]|jgi:CRISPR-associated endoribonuclease Cas6|nr:CRISPR-associated endoribonuclease Cas6 [Bacteroidales bacterium]
MLFKLNVELDRQQNILPINYQYELSSFIYKTLQRGNLEYSKWLHNNGFQLNGKSFKLFTFSNFIIPSYTIDREKGRILIHSDSVYWYISFLPERSTENFIKGIFLKQKFSIGDKKTQVDFYVKNVEIIPEPEFKEEMYFKTLTPISISRKNNNGKIEYVNPAEEYAKQAVLKNLLNKYHVFYGKEYPINIEEINFDFVHVSEPKSKLILIKAGTSEETRVRGYNCKFKINAPVDLIKIMYNSGIGEKGSLGFGMVEVMVK